MNRVRRGWRRLRRGLGYGLAGLVIVAGLAVALLGQLLPLLARHPDQVADWLSRQSGRPVELTGVQAAWTRQGPRLDLEGLRIGAGDDRLDIGRAELQLHVYSGLLPGRPLSSLQLTGLVLELERDTAGGWRLQGLGRGGGSATAALEQLDAFGELNLHSARLRYRDVPLDIDYRIPEIHARLRSDGERQVVGMLAMVGDGAPLRFNLEFDPRTLHGRGYFGSPGLELDDVRGLLPFDSTAVATASLAGGVWFELGRDGLSEARFSFELDRLRLAGADPARPWLEAPLPLDGRWRREPDGWGAIMESARDGNDGYLAVKRSDAGAVELEAADWSLAPLLALVARTPAMAPRLADWLRDAAAAGQLRGLRARLQQGELDWLEARVDGLQFAAVDDQPGLSGISLALLGDRDGLDIEFVGSPMRVEWPEALLAPLESSARGRLQWFDNDGIPSVEIGQLTLVGPDYGIAAAGSLAFDGGKPSVALRADVAPGPITAAQRFWIRNRMPPRTVAWLDNAIEDGWIEHGTALLAGDLDDWPFDRNRAGRFDAEVRIRDTRLQFRPDWPAAEQLAGTVRFVDRSMVADTRGMLRGLQASRAVGTIEAFNRPVLALDIEAEGSGPVMLGLLRNSPLQISHGQYLDTLTIGGRGEVDLSMAIPLKPSLGAAEVHGTVELHDADLHDRRWDIEFADASGEVRFSDRGLLADGLDVRYADQPARLGLAIGSFTSRPSNIAEARLQGRIEAGSLLALAPATEWLRPYWSGSSEWLLELAVPQPERALAPTLRVRSDLVGTRIALPAPLAKADAVQMPLQLHYDLPVVIAPGDERPVPGRLDLRLGELLRLYGRLDESGRLDGVAAFGTVPVVERPEQGLQVVGQVPVLDLGGWAGLALAASGDGGGMLAGVDISAGEIDLMDRSFAETRLQFVRSVDGSARLEVSGDPIEGIVELPAPALRPTHGITARFDRLHWPDADAGSARLTVADPTLLPPLHVWVRDLQLGEAVLGEARLETFPVEHGTRVERFETRSPALELFARGDWTRDGLHQRSDFAIDFTAPDLGAMLGALGFDALIDGGQTLVRLQAGWPGAPTAFSLDAVDGWLEVSVGKGRIPKVDPGGVGRVFGLLSLSEIPRRLALDFSDFFRSGLAFNRIEGRFALDDGDAVTENLLIDGPAAEIHIRGRTGLGARDYEQTMEVLPRAGNVLPVVGALAGGPAGAAIGAVAQAVLSNPFKQMSRTLYKVEGSWDDPRIEVLERGPARAPGPTIGAAGEAAGADLDGADNEAGEPAGQDERRRPH